MDALKSAVSTLLGQNGPIARYELTHLIFSSSCIAAAPATLVFDAPFGRFSWGSTPLSFNANFGWFLMEIVSPITMLVSLLSPPFLLPTPLHTEAGVLARWSSLNAPTKLLASLYLIHYLNRSTISVLRNPAKRAPMHIMILLSSVAFNLANGFLMGSWLGGRTRSLTDLLVVQQGANTNNGGVDASSFSSPLFWAGLVLWAVGLAGNIIHDDILMDIRRPDPTGKPKPRYAVPHGWLYSKPLGGISFPSYFCEWCEWLGFAMACSTAGHAPALIAGSPSATASTMFANYLGPLKVVQNITPPWMFFVTEILVMMPRALRGHRWYHDKFGKDMPRERKAVVPGVL